MNKAGWREFVYWLSKAPAHLSMSDSDVAEALWQRHPRRQFLKALPVNAKLLDIGAGSGGLSFWRGGKPERWDIQFYGTDFAVGEHHNNYVAWEATNLDERMPAFPGVQFDAFMASHVIEHLAAPETLIAYMAGVAAEGARVYFEWPAPKTVDFPSRDEFHAATGCSLSTLNFYDDSTHRMPLEPALIAGMLEANGFAVVNGGEIELGEIAIEAMARGRDRNSDMQTGLWCATGWATYLQAQRISQRTRSAALPEPTASPTSQNCRNNRSM